MAKKSFPSIPLFLFVQHDKIKVHSLYNLHQENCIYLNDFQRSNGVVIKRFEKKMSETRKRPVGKTDSLPLDDLIDDG